MILERNVRTVNSTADNDSDEWTKGKDMYNDARRTRGKDGNMNTQQHFKRDTISATKTEQEK